MQDLKLTVYLVVVLLIVGTTPPTKGELQLPTDDLFPSDTLSPAELHESLDDNVRGERIFAYYTSTTLTGLTTSTLTALSTCLSIAQTDPCRRRKRGARGVAGFHDLEKDLADLNLDGALSAVENLETLSQSQRDPRDLPGGREDRKLTIWTTGFTTLTLTTTSYLAGTTVTATAYCVTPGLTAGCFGK